MEQADYSDCTQEEQGAIRFLIGSLDDRGFLTSSLSDLAPAFRYFAYNYATSPWIASQL